MKAIVAFSGGQDSTTILCKAVRDHGSANVLALSADYGQRHSRELISAGIIAEFLGCAHEVVSMKGILVGASPLTDSGRTLETYTSAAEMAEVIGSRREKTFVPLRNPLFLTVAANRAAAYGANEVWTGICEADNANYSDCTSAFALKFEQMVNEANGYYTYKGIDRINLMTPLMHKSKADTIKLALEVPDAFYCLSLSHTAYSGEYPPKTQDHATVLREDGFRELDIPDPLILRAMWEGYKLPVMLEDRYTRYADRMGHGLFSNFINHIAKEIADVLLD